MTYVITYERVAVVAAAEAEGAAVAAAAPVAAQQPMPLPFAQWTGSSHVRTAPLAHGSPLSC